MTITAFDRGFGDPLLPTFHSQNIVKVTAGGVSVNIHKDTNVIWACFLTEMEAVHGEGFFGRDKDDWGYNKRPIRGKEQAFKNAEAAYKAAIRRGDKNAAKSAFDLMMRYLSNHSWGTAVDLNAISNPMGPKRTTFKIPKTNELCFKYGISWGYNYVGARKDAMHFEILLTAADARRRNRDLARFLAGIGK